MSPDPERIRAAEAELAERDAIFATALQTAGPVDWRFSERCYATLARLVTYQAVSTEAAAAVWGRLEAELGEVTADTALDAGEDALRECGLSRPKCRHLSAIADALSTGALDLGCLAELDDAAAQKHLVAVPGIGPWTARLYLMYAEARFDIFPDNDVGLLEAYVRLKGLEERPSFKEFAVIAEAWSPHRSVATHLLWAWINVQKGRHAKA